MSKFKVLTSVFVLLFTSSIFSQNYFPTPVGSLMGFYPFNGNADDVSGNKYDGQLSGPVKAKDRFGKKDSSYFFDGSNDYIKVNNLSPDMNDLSVSFWFKTDNIKGDSKRREIISSTGQNKGFRFYQEYDYIYFECQPSNILLSFQLTSTDSSHWTHIVSLSQGGKYYLFKNGKQIDYKSGSTASNAVYPIYFGRGPLAGSNKADYWGGYMDDIRIYNRILDTSEISQLYKEKPTVLCTSTTYDTVIVFDSISVYDTTKVTVFDTTSVFDTVTITSYDSISVTDTLIIEVNLVGQNPPKTNIIKAYPNPAKDVLMINTGNYSLMTNYSLRIIDNSGKIVYLNYINKQTFSLDLNTFGGKGLYFIQILGPKSKIVENRKIILD